MKRISRMVGMLVIIAGLMYQTILYAQDDWWSPEQVYYGPGGVLNYTPDEQGNVIPDFSQVGYMYGDVGIPDVPVVVEVGPVEGDDGANIQAAIDMVAAMTPAENGFRGAVLLKKGTYQVSGQLFIQASGVVIRGEGQTDEGTVVIADGTKKRDFIVIGNGAGRKLQFATRTAIVEDYVPLGRKFVVVDDASGYSAGDLIVLYRPGTSNWISDLQMDQIPDPDGTTTQWTPSSYSFYFERLATKVSGDTIFFRNPVVMAMETNYGGGSVYKGISERIQNVGVEDLCLKSAYKSDNDEDHAWEAVVFNSIEHGWARRITSWYFGFSCVSLNGKSRLVTVEDSHCREPKSQISGGRRYSFNISGSLNLVKDCSTTEGRHDYATGSRVCGPNVFTNCTAENAHADTGPHHRWAMGTLYDIIVSDYDINVEDRGPSGSGHGWSGANQVFWNCTGASSACQSPWVSAKNYNFGFTGKKDPGRYIRPDGVWVGHNRPGIFPESLYLAQLYARTRDQRIFSAYSTLEKENDSSFVMSYNLPIDKLLAVPGNFSVAGNAGFEGAGFTLEALSDSSVMLVFDGIGPLPAFSSVVVHTLNMKSASGEDLGGLTSATYVEPDLRPIVTAVYAKVNNEDGTLEASSSKPGTIYLVKYTGNYYYLEDYTTISDLDQAVANNLGRKAVAQSGNTVVSFPSLGLPGGFYIYYAVDSDGRISLPSDAWPEVVATGPLLGMEQDVTKTGYSVWSFNGIIYIQPDDHSVNYSVQIFDVTGRRYNVSLNMSGDQQLNAPNYHGILIIQLISGKGKSVVTRQLSTLSG